MYLTRRTFGCGIALVLMLAGSATAKPSTGVLSGVVLDLSGTPQMGAAVWLLAEDGTGRTVSQLLTNQHGAFSSELKPGKYSVRVSLAGFLPAWERHVTVVADITTLLRVQIDSVFASLDRLRRNPDVQTDSADWKWVLRSSAATRTILQWRDGNAGAAANLPNADVPQSSLPLGLVELTSGSLTPESLSGLPNSPGTDFAYDQSLGGMGHVVVAGLMNYDGGTSGGFASIWLPSGVLGSGPETIFVERRGEIGLHDLTYQGMRIDHSEEIAIGGRMSLRAGAEYVRVGTTSSIAPLSSVASLRPHARLDANLTPGWIGTFFVAASPSDVQLNEASELQSAIADLDTLPTLLFRGGRPVLQGDWHQELALNHKLSDRSSVSVATFHDSARHQAMFGSSPDTTPDFFQNPFSRIFTYDAGASNSWGMRLAYQRKILKSFEFAAVYSWAGALSPGSDLNVTPADLRESFVTRYHHSVAARISGKLPRAGTQFAASYKWISGTILTREDPFGDAAYLLDPNLNLSVRQPLPRFGRRGRWEAVADFSNLLAQGYVPLENGQDSPVHVVPVLRSFRGGVSFQF